MVAIPGWDRVLKRPLLLLQARQVAACGQEMPWQGRSQPFCPRSVGMGQSCKSGDGGLKNYY